MRARTTWLVFAIASAVVAAVMLGVSWALVRLDDGRVAGQRDAAREELVRLALWRMDAVLTPVLSREIAEAGLPLVDGRLPPGVRARFVIRQGSDAEAVGAIDPEVRAELLALIAAQEPERTQLAFDNATRDVAGSYRNVKGNQALDGGIRQTASVDPNDFDRRVANLQDNLVQSSSINPSYHANAAVERDGVGFGEGGRDEGLADDATVPLAVLELMRPLWWGDELVMVRRVRDADGEHIDGSWLDWPKLSAQLHDEIADLLPTARLRPIEAGQGSPARRLATLPLELDPGVVPMPDDRAAAPLRVAIAAAWAFVAIAVGAVAMLLRGSLGLSERRAEFVSAVTHELRTPLTTFRMYTDMLADGMVEPAKRDRYVTTLRRESERLAQLVENVLGYARIEAEGGRKTRELGRVTIASLVDGCGERLAERCRNAGLELDVVVEPEAGDARVRVDEVAIEQILFNLVDNAAKYGASADEPIVRLTARVVGRRVELEVADRGPGVPAPERARVFEPFSKGAAHQAGTKPGVGLGLALARRLAESMGGKLELRPSDAGARFVLSVSRA